MKNPTLQSITSTTALIGLSLLLLMCVMSTPWFYTALSGLSYNPQHTPSLLFFITFNILCFLVIPIASNKFTFKQHTHELGLQLPKNKIISFLLICLGLISLIPCIVYMSHNTISQHYYSLSEISSLQFGFILCVILPLYYFAEEFFFRGFLFMTLWRKVGWHSYWITDIFFTMAHIGKPPLEILVAIPASIIFSYLTLKTKSILPSMLVHYTMGVVLIVLVNHHQ